MKTSKTKSRTNWIDCPECEGNGYVEYEYVSPMSNSVPYGDYYSQFEPCPNCGGDGEIEALDEDDE